MKKVASLAVALILLPAIGLAHSVRLENLRYYSYPEYTRVVLDLSAAVKIQEKILRESSGGRLYFDLSHCILSRSYPAEKRREISIEAGNLRRVRIGNKDARTIRVVFDFDRIGRYQRFYLTSPFRIVFDIFQSSAPQPSVQRSESREAVAAGTKPSIARQLGLKAKRIVIDPATAARIRVQSTVR